MIIQHLITTNDDINNIKTRWKQHKTRSALIYQCRSQGAFFWDSNQAFKTELFNARKQNIFTRKGGSVLIVENFSRKMLDKSTKFCKAEIGHFS